MGIKLSVEKFDKCIKELQKNYKIYAPVLMEGKGTFSDTDTVRYAEINSITDIEFQKKANFSAKEVLLPITETLFYFTEDEYIEPKKEEKGVLIFLRSCDIHAVKRIDEIYLRNGFEDPYYKTRREKVKFVLMGCQNSFENCFCVSMGSNTTDEYDMYVKLQDENVFMDIKSDEFQVIFEGETSDVTPDFVESNEVKVNVPENIDIRIFKSKMWKEYSERCIACGRCNFVCPTCTCFTMQDIFYKDNPKNGERRRVWASCQVDGYTTMAGGHGFRQDKGDRMRFKVMHKVYDFKKRNGYHMCVGCGRCDDACPEYISFSNCVNKLNDAMKEVE
ncbi:anaerobic sulfite reductase subunit AsrA [Clostridium colicanis]|uniref:Anaerobic sulfite reductase subunit A n=1 Tax=Clostridium colicanis DSM 13634 TaxID=1121305 RepID=A0A151AP02_9CLOT|nr:anaerobic sulfite reductase subunit AsrA [Clostridium colicanis]KYH29356.1 anaerobic sulfite reductase subunit A [Clostridium colicanis DSM 13634]